MIRTLRRALPLLLAVCLTAALTGCGATHHRSGAGRGGTHTAASGGTATVAGSGTGTGPGTGAGSGTGAGTGPGAGTGTGIGTGTGTGTTGGDAGSSGVVYGIGDAQGLFARCTPGVAYCCSTPRARCSPSRTTGFFANPLFVQLTAASSAHRVRDVRLFVDYDAVEQWNGSTTAPGCTYSHTINGPYEDLADGYHTPGQSIEDLVAGVIEARAEGLTPVISIEGFNYATATPPGDIPFPDPTTIGGAWAYRCGLQGILGVLSRLPAAAQPHDWEAVNEPEGFRIFRSSDGSEASSCAVSATGQPDGPAKAACVEVLASRVIHGFKGHAGDAVIAGTFKHPYPSYLAPYAAMLEREMPGSAFPPIWSVHDYPEVTGAYATRAVGAQLAAFDHALARDTSGRARSLWVTEAGTVLTSQLHGGECPAAGVDPARTLGACVNGQAARQATDAAAFFTLPHVASAVPITHLFWYQFEGALHWDSALLDASGRPRTAYCIFLGRGSCDGDPAAS